ncbi:MAG TPA: OsmC family protein [bacterium]|nr:OsmC family protein [bacterium]
MDAIVRWTKGLAFTGTAGSGGVVTMDEAPARGGTGPTPMEVVLLALGGCTGMDVVSILRKMRAPLEDVEIRVTGERAEEHPRVFTRIDVEYVFKGEGLKAEQVQRAVELSQDRYCSVWAMLQKGTVLTHTWRIDGGAAQG